MTYSIARFANRTIIQAVVGLGVALAPLTGTTGAAWAGEVTVFAAASTTNAITDIIAAFNGQGVHSATPSFASSSTLAKQIEQGAPAGIFLSANGKWMEYLAERGLVVEGSRVDLLGNRLALISPKSNPSSLTEISAQTDLVGALGEGRLSLGDPEHVPAGLYAKEALTNLGLWESVSDKVAPASDVRAALSFVERNETPLGIVYSTDAAVSDGVVVTTLFPESSHKKITYPAAIIAAQDNDAARAFLEYLKAPESKAVFEKYGFQVNE
ncbi:MAG: molybdate ABC transporter substrate-binding protein [Rhodospirillum sp.]|nr:molybdate ABC transporter substrate-binding protein [Rhodospirillum sp.]MCF8490862.1 molybdate ABC transporter substrate-binding protein [Rhodospirillum sp.]MCF8500098.1 molybdate ABC transporter substrate-binding protein [Rhodospirillum sp.]